MSDLAAYKKMKVAVSARSHPPPPSDSAPGTAPAACKKNPAFR